MVSKIRLSVLLLVFLILVPVVCLPANAASIPSQNVAVTKLVDESNYKKTLFVIATSDNTYHIIVQANISEVGNEQLINLSATLYNPANETLIASARTPDTLTDAPYYKGAVQAFRLHLTQDEVIVLDVALVVVLVAALVYQVYNIIEELIEQPISQALGTLLFGGPFIYASIPWVLLTVLRDTDPDGSINLYFPYAPLNVCVNLILQNTYFIATDLHWWKISEVTVTFLWVVLFTYYVATVYSDRIATPHSPPTAQFVWNPNQPVAGETVSFTSTSYAQQGTNITTYLWTLGDGGHEGIASFNYNYSNEGVYNVTLQVTDSNGLSDSISHNVTVQSMVEAAMSIAPVTLEASVQSGQSVSSELLVGETLNQTDLTNVNFEASDLTNYYDNQTISSGNVTFGSNAITVTKGTYTNVSVAFNAPLGSLIGWYSGNITITSDNGGNGTVFVDLFVYGAPIANFTWIPQTPAVNETVMFDASSSITGGGQLVAYNWDFGDGLTASGETAEHTFANAMNYTVTLNVTDSNGSWNTTQAQVHVVSVGVHGVNVTDINAPTWVYQDILAIPNDCANISVVVSNLGNFPEDAWVTLYYDIASNRSIGAYPVALDVGQNYILQFIWNTEGVPCGNYTLTAVATIANGSNTFTDGNITVRLVGDVNGDGRVDLKDIALVARAFGSTPSSPNWNPYADINGDGIVNMKDIILVARHFGEQLP